MEKKKLMEFLVKIPDDVRCDVHGECNSSSWDCEVSVWCGKYLIRGWKEALAKHADMPVEDIISRYSADNWKTVGYADSVNGEEFIGTPSDYDNNIAEARKAVAVDWNMCMTNEIAEFRAAVPTEKQISFAKAIRNALGLGNSLDRHWTKKDYSDFISGHIAEYRKWRDDNDPSNYDWNDDCGGPEQEF